MLIKYIVTPLTDERHYHADGEDDVRPDEVVSLLRPHVLQVQLLVEQQPEADCHHAESWSENM